jgi:hypothetical protein
MRRTRIGGIAIKSAIAVFHKGGVRFVYEY